ncbi:MAG TPA: gas vesicle protein GvpJ [Mycobacteriales bacterium]|nr:gas vesicle protein GvpJ [Mycobacteriales bacterium]
MSDLRTSNNGLVDLIDRLLDAGAVVAGQVTVTLADIDLIDLDLRLLLTSVEASRRRAGLGPRTPSHRQVRPLPPMPAPPALPERVEAGKRGEDGLARLVLVLVDLLRQLLASQALERLEGGSLDDVEVEQLGRALLLLEQRCEALRNFLVTDDTWRPFPQTDRSVMS